MAKLMGAEHKEILLEDPCHIGMLKVLEQNGGKLCPIPVDELGIRTDCLKASDASAIYVTPSHHFPLGGILPIARRFELVRFAEENDLYIIEDDYDSEFRYIGPPITPLYSIRSERVIYIGTFSKSVFPALRIGFVILPDKLRSAWRKALLYTDVQNPILEQVALAGLHMAVSFHGKCFDQEFIYICRREGLRITTVEYHCIVKGSHTDKLLIGYGHLGEEDIRKGIKLLKKLMDGQLL